MKRGFYAGLCVCCLILLMSASLVAAPGAQAKGHWLVGGNASLMKSNGDLYEVGGDGVTTIVISPFAGIFVTDGFALGGVFEVSSASRAGSSQTTIGIGPDLRYYFISSGGSNAIPFARFAFEYYDQSGGGFDASGTTIHLGGGLTYMLSSSVGLSGEGFYERDRLDPGGVSGSASGNQFGVLFGFSLFLGHEQQ